MGCTGVIHMFFTRKVKDYVVDETLQSQIAALKAQVTTLNMLIAQQAAAIEKVTLAFNSFRARVYAWKRFEDPTLSTTPEATTPAVDKAAILRQHRSKQ